MGDLNRYYGKLREQAKMIDNDLKDICLDLNDININTWILPYKVEIQHSQESGWNIPKLMNGTDVYPVVERIVDYLKGYNYNVKYRYEYTHPSDKWRFFNKIRNRLRGKVYYTTIVFKSMTINQR